MPGRLSSCCPLLVLLPVCSLAAAPAWPPDLVLLLSSLFSLSLLVAPPSSFCPLLVFLLSCFCLPLGRGCQPVSRPCPLVVHAREPCVLLLSPWCHPAVPCHAVSCSCPPGALLRSLCQACAHHNNSNNNNSSCRLSCLGSMLV